MGAHFRFVRWSVLAVLGAAQGVVGCAAILGREELPAAPFQPAPEPRGVQYRDARITVSAEWRGAGEFVATARNSSGRISRVVNPFGADVTCLSVEVSARGEESLVVQPDLATLQLGAQAPRRALSLDAYRKRWPAWAVRSEEQASDRRVAWNHVLEALWIERRIEPGRSHRATLAFPAGPLAGRPVLRLPYQGERGPGVALVAWRLDG